MNAGAAKSEVWEEGATDILAVAAVVQAAWTYKLWIEQCPIEDLMVSGQRAVCKPPNYDIYSPMVVGRFGKPC
jgi:deoxyribose-phosphate aldolase